MKIYSTFKINIVSFLITIAIYLFFIFYIPKTIHTIRTYIYYKSQPDLLYEYEENLSI